jgi:hypothetical protein
MPSKTTENELRPQRFYEQEDKDLVKKRPKSRVVGAIATPRKLSDKEKREMMERRALEQPTKYEPPWKLPIGAIVKRPKIITKEEQDEAIRNVRKKLLNNEWYRNAEKNDMERLLRKR